MVLIKYSILKGVKMTKAEKLLKTLKIADPECKVIINWNQELIRIHMASNQQPDGCQVEDMVDSECASSEAEAKKKILANGKAEFRKCEHCWPENQIECYRYSKVGSMHVKQTS